MEERSEEREDSSQRLANELGLPGGMDKSDDAQQHGYARIPVQYVGRSGPTVEMKRVPILPSQQQAADQARATLSSGGTGPGSGRSVTAMESVHLSHTQQLDRIKTADPHFKRSSDTYGSRKPIEQFGISHHGVKQSAITNWYRRDMGQI
eukprot:CAMPEP_0202867428 /NCGR_PEP_ID=MMETSP1391-20130828/9424_1 /ASSEMBLY_ACC=CAM_ASM_000867 /TAXON_ID=1034604 /ORGANISM="Chlamydomonas leiostraca, Strain SAG 11-49" /LENGTH=149 /DNA_ID=CAMNT_0049547475 /DNA_START=71 /DNA_END=521 /DNA_ORIENTATION=+